MKWMENILPFGLKASFIAFRCGKIVGIQKITSIPEFPEYVKGVINLRGSIIPVIDARLRLKAQETLYNEHTRIVTVSIKKRLFALQPTL